MKKILIPLMVLTMVLSFNSFVFGGVNTGETKMDGQTEKAAVSQLKSDFSANRIEILDLKSELLSLHADIKTAIMELRDSDEDISEEKLAAIKDSLQIIKEDRAALRQLVNEDFKPLLADYKSAMEERDFSNAKENLERLIDLQEERIELLQNTSDDMKTLLSIL